MVCLRMINPCVPSSYEVQLPEWKASPNLQITIVRSTPPPFSLSFLKYIEVVIIEPLLLNDHHYKRVPSILHARWKPKREGPRRPRREQQPESSSSTRSPGTQTCNLQIVANSGRIINRSGFYA